MFTRIGMLLFVLTSMVVLAWLAGSRGEPFEETAVHARSEAALGGGIASSPANARTNTRRSSDLFPSLDQLMTDPRINPRGVRLEASILVDAERLRARAEVELQEIDNAFSEAQTAIARERILSRQAHRHEPGDRVPPRGSLAAVVVARIEEVPGTWLVRISDEELPQAAAWRDEAQALRAGLYSSLRRLTEVAGTDSVSR